MCKFTNAILYIAIVLSVDCLPTDCFAVGISCNDSTCSITSILNTNFNGLVCLHNCSRGLTCSFEQWFPQNEVRCNVCIYAQTDNCTFTISDCSWGCNRLTINNKRYFLDCYCDIPTPSISQISTSMYPRHTTESFSHSEVTNTPQTRAHTSLSNSPVTTTIKSATMMDSLPYSTVSSTSNLVTATHQYHHTPSHTSIVVPVIAGVIPVCLLLLLLTVIGSILACTLYKRRAKHIIERPQIYTHGQLK